MRSTANECSWILKQDLVIIVLFFHQLHFLLLVYVWFVNVAHGIIFFY